MNFRGFILFMVLILAAAGQKANAQVIDSLMDSAAVRAKYSRWKLRDSAYVARQNFVTDSIMKHSWLFPDSMVNKHMIIDSIIKANVYGRSDLINRYKDHIS